MRKIISVVIALLFASVLITPAFANNVTITGYIANTTYNAANFIGPPPGIEWWIGCGISGTTADHVSIYVSWGDGSFLSFVSGNNANYIPGLPGPYAYPANHNYATPTSYPFTWTGFIQCQPYNGSGDMGTVSFTYTLTYTPNPTVSTGGGGGMGGGHARPI